jgi:predicted small integral membrane protein
MRRLGTLPVTLAALTAITGLYFALIVFGNVTDFDTNWQFVKHVLAMDTTFGDPDVTWRRITAVTFAGIAYGLIILWEALTAVVLIASFVMWIRTIAGKPSAELARGLSTLGWTMAIVLFAGGFIVIGGEWFQMWQSKSWNGLQPALQNVIIAGIGLIVANLPDRKAQ